ncbi:MAG TPA: hypothetical protein VIT23_13135 [Terrimicrobiaceae bacterium]
MAVFAFAAAAGCGLAPVDQTSLPYVFTLSWELTAQEGRLMRLRRLRLPITGYATGGPLTRATDGSVICESHSTRQAVAIRAEVGWLSLFSSSRRQHH